MPIKRGTATRLGLDKPQPQQTWEVEFAPLIPQHAIAEFIREFREAHEQAVTEISRVVFKVATEVRRSRQERSDP